MTVRPRISVVVETQKRERMAGDFYGSTEPYACALMNWERAGVNRQQSGCWEVEVQGFLPHQTRSEFA